MYLLPRPQQEEWYEGYYALRYDGYIVLEETSGVDGYPYMKQLQEVVAQETGLRLKLRQGSSKKADITLRVDASAQAQAYTLTVDQNGIWLSAGDSAGLLYGIQTLRQIFRQKGACIPCLKISDYPCFPVRGLFYDVTRGRIPTLEYLKKLADRMVCYKMNQLQLYIEHSFLFENLSEVWRDDTPLTAEDILEFDRYCKARNIELVPAIASFGHLYKVLRTKSFRRLCERPELADAPFGFVDRMNHHTLDVSNAESLCFVKGLIKEYMALFSSDKFNICADETFDLGKGRSHALAKEKGVHRLYVDFVKELCSFLQEQNRQPMFWGDIISECPELLKELPEGTICLSWGYGADESGEAVRKVAAAGAVQYCCPGVSGWNQFVNQIDVSYQNIKRMCQYGRECGAAGILNTDWGDCGHINHPDFGITGMIYGAVFSWGSEMPAYEELNRQISFLEFRDRSEKFVSIIEKLSRTWIYQWYDAVDFMEKRSEAKDSTQCSGLPEAVKGLEVCAKELCGLLPELDSAVKACVPPYLMAVDGMILLQKVGAFVSAREYGDAPLFSENAADLAAELEEWFYAYKEEWRRVSRESELYRIESVICWYADYLRREF
ncbi:MAG: family 20 glycosylhydrolase [Lachnospiraceae bacterium]|nr:family 20 glycosylhydrolase [Lachnospiraceae bacterium]